MPRCVPGQWGRAGRGRWEKVQLPLLLHLDCAYGPPTSCPPRPQRTPASGRNKAAGPLAALEGNAGALAAVAAVDAAAAHLPQEVEVSLLPVGAWGVGAEG